MLKHSPVCVFLLDFSCPADVASSSYSSESVIWLIEIYADEKSDKNFTCSLICLLEVNKNTLTVIDFPNLGFTGFVLFFHGEAGVVLLFFFNV